MLAAYPLTGASTNPARSLGPAIFSDNLGSYWIYVIGPLVGALVGGLVYRLLHYNWKKSTACIKDAVLPHEIYGDSCQKVDACQKVEACHKPVTCHKPAAPTCGKQYKVDQTFTLPEVKNYSC